MPPDTLIALAVFAGVLVCTPGPANMLLFAAGARGGLRANLPLVAGVTAGKLFIHAGLALGLWRLAGEFPKTLLVLKIAGAVYILWLAWRILRIKIQKNGAAAAGFFAGLAVHPLNPKAWAMVVSAYGQFIVPEKNWWAQTAAVAAVFFCWQCAAHTFWCWSGARAADFAGAPTFLPPVLAAAMVGAVLWALFN